MVRMFRGAPQALGRLSSSCSLVSPEFTGKDLTFGSARGAIFATIIGFLILSLIVIGLR
jgi:hypothetical protein